MFSLLIFVFYLSEVKHTHSLPLLNFPASFISHFGGGVAFSFLKPGGGEMGVGGGRGGGGNQGPGEQRGYSSKLNIR